jgi:hypothetical protein
VLKAVGMTWLKIVEPWSNGNLFIASSINMLRGKRDKFVPVFN